MKKLFLAVAVAALGFAASPAAMAQATPTPPNGTGSVASNCNNTAVAGDSCVDQDLHVHAGIYGACYYVEVGNLEFGNHRTVTADATYTATTQVDVACNANQNYAVSLDNGVNSSGAGNRRVVDSTGSSYMTYTLASSSGTAFGDGTTGNGSVVTGTGTGQNQSIPINGTLTQTSANKAGDYTDLVTATLTLQ